jgi:hypothetical protein
MTAVTRRWLALVLVVSSSVGASAQDAPAFRSRQVIVSAGLAAASGYQIGQRTADLRRNGAGTDPLPLFRTESAFDAAAGVEARVAFALTRAFSVEGGGTFSRPTLGVRITQDSEGAPDTRATESISQYTVEVSGLYHLPGRTLGTSARPYLIGGGGYLRQLHEDRFLLETGGLGYAGGGVHYWLRGKTGRSRPVGIRGEVSVVVRSRGIDFEDRSRVYPRLSALGFIAF